MRKFGLIGFPLGHSFSGKYFRGKFEREQILDCSYANFELPAISDLSAVLEDPELEGLNVTIPYKESVISFLDRKDIVVEETGACNCIHIKNGERTGYNTDVIGFEKSLSEKLSSDDYPALVLGTGGSSKAVAWVLNKRNIPFLFVSRQKAIAGSTIRYSDIDQKLIETHRLIINTTPVGMAPGSAFCPPIPYQYLGRQHYLFDLVYNPEKTLFLEKGEAAGARIKNGNDMLVIQAEASWSIWNRG
jgi:shikimate dehydrogenase